MITIPWSFTTTLIAFLEQPKFAARTRESYAQDLLPLAALLAEQPITVLTEEVVTKFRNCLARKKRREELLLKSQRRMKKHRANHR